MHDPRTGANPSQGCNGWLAALEPADRARLLPGIARRDAARGAVLAGPGGAPALLPCGRTVVSLAAPVPQNGFTDTILVGAETLLTPVSGHAPTWQVIARVPGPYLVLDTDVLREAADRSPALRDAICRAADCLLAELMVSAACGAVHDLRQRLARCLLAVADRQPEGRVPLTHAYLASLLGVQRTTVSEAAASLAAEGLIRTGRVSIEVRQREALGAAACACYMTYRAHFDRVLPGRWMHPAD